MDHQGAGSAGARRRQPWKSPPGSPQYGDTQYGESPDEDYDEAYYGDTPYGGPPPGTGPEAASVPRGTAQLPAAQGGYRPGPGATGAYAPPSTTGAYATGAYPPDSTGAYGTNAFGARQGTRTASGPQQAIGPASGPQPAYGPGSGPQPVSGPQPAYRSGSGAQPVLGPGSGPLRALDRDPARGFPPRGAQEHAADSWYSSAGGYTPPATGGYATPATGDYAPASGYGPSATGSYAHVVPDSYPPSATGSYAVPVPDSYPPSASAYERGDEAARYDQDSDDEPIPVPVRDRDRDPAPRRRLLRRPAVLGTVAVLVLAALGAGGYYKFVYEPRSATARADRSLKLPAPGATAGSPSSAAKLSWQHIDTRKQDPTPISLDELFPPAFSLAGSEYLKATASLTSTCGLAVFGDLIQAALQAGGCSQVARASYVSGDGKIMGTIGVANLSSAYRAGQAAKTASATELVAPLAASRGPTKKLLTGTGLAYAEVKGHYLILFYAEFTSTKTPATAAEKQELVAFCNGMFSGSADIPLSRRMLYGKP
jgi:hypothetical protein